MTNHNPYGQDISPQMKTFVRVKAQKLKSEGFSLEDALGILGLTYPPAALDYVRRIWSSL